MSKISRITKKRKDLVAFVRDTADKSIIGDFPTSYHAYLNEMIQQMTDHPETRIVIQQSRQMGKSTMTQVFIDAFVNATEVPTFIKKFYLRSGTFEFRLFLEPRSWELVKLTKPNKWRATNLEYIFEFLVRRGANIKDIAEVEQRVFERM